MHTPRNEVSAGAGGVGPDSVHDEAWRQTRPSQQSNSLSPPCSRLSSRERTDRRAPSHNAYFGSRDGLPIAAACGLSGRGGQPPLRASLGKSKGEGAPEAGPA